MNSKPGRLRWLAIGLAAWLGIGCAERPPAPAGQRPQHRSTACTDSDVVGDLDPRRPC